MAYLQMVENSSKMVVRKFNHVCSLPLLIMWTNLNYLFYKNIGLKIRTYQNINEFIENLDPIVWK